MHSIYTAIVLAAVLTASDLRMRENDIIMGTPKSSYNISYYLTCVPTKDTDQTAKIIIIFFFFLYYILLSNINSS